MNKVFKKKMQVKTQTDLVSFTDFSHGGKEKEGTLVALDSKNCDYTGGSLKNGVGLASYLYTDGKIWTVPVTTSEIFQFFFCTEKETFQQLPAYVTKTGSMFCFNSSTRQFEEFADKEPMRAFEVMDKEANPFIVLSGREGIYTFKPETRRLANTVVASASTIGCVCKNRFFCVEPPFTILYSEALNAKIYKQTIEDSGRIVFPSSDGKIVALKTFLNSVYIFYEYGVAKLEVGGSPRDFKFSKIEYGGGKILGDSVGVCSVGGEKIFFLAENGLHRLKGDKVDRICKNLSIHPRRTGQVCAEAHTEGKYFVCYTEITGEAISICVDAETEKGYFFFGSDGLSSWRGKAFCFTSTDVRVLREGSGLPAGETCYFNVRKVAFGETGVKTVKRLHFFGRGKIDVVLEADGKKIKKTVALGNGKASMRCDLRGESFSLNITLYPNTTVTSLQAETVKLKK